jgi:hypothetical protein
MIPSMASGDITTTMVTGESLKSIHTSRQVAFALLISHVLSFEGMFRNGKRNGRGKYQLTDGRVEIYRYVNDSRVGDGVRWSADRKKAWRMINGKVNKRVTTEEAVGIANRCGPVIDSK